MVSILSGEAPIVPELAVVRVGKPWRHPSLSDNFGSI
jgi:hypothetical protein